MWPYVLAAYLLSPLIVGLVFHPDSSAASHIKRARHNSYRAKDPV
jgi:hypothetical protein